jgi:hypothetical protein
MSKLNATPIRWDLWCNIHGREDTKYRVTNNLVSIVAHHHNRNKLNQPFFTPRKNRNLHMRYISQLGRSIRQRLAQLCPWISSEKPPDSIWSSPQANRISVQSSWILDDRIRKVRWSKIRRVWRMECELYQHTRDFCNDTFWFVYRRIVDLNHKRFFCLTATLIIGRVLKPYKIWSMKYVESKEVPRGR